MRSISTVIILFSLILLSGCSSFGLSSDVYNAQALQSAKTYQWGSDPIEASSGVTNNLQVLDVEIRKRLNTLMKDKGIKESDNADLIVDYKYKLDKTVTSTPVANTQPQVTLNSEGMSLTPVDEGQPVVSLSGAIVVTITDSKSGSEVYQAKVTNDDLTATTIDQLRAQLDKLLGAAERDIPNAQ